MQNDIAVSENYQRLVTQTLTGVYDRANDTKTVLALRDELIGALRTSLGNVFDDLNLESIGDPLGAGSFYFRKGTATVFHYKNLSAGEKSVFDLLLDMIIKKINYPDAIFCIDEPEAHMHTRLQSRVLRELYRLIPGESQLWITTHSIGMLKEAQDIEQRAPGTVFFLEFDGRDFDATERITPGKMTKAIWDKFFELTLGDFAALIAPRRVVFCEGTPKGRNYKDFDAQIYSRIFESTYPDTKFVSIGSSSELEKIENSSTNVVANILKSTIIVKFVDRDGRSPREIADLLTKGIKTSKKRHIESYLFDDEIIRKLCVNFGKEGLVQQCLDAKKKAIQDSTARGNPSDDIKSASGTIFVEVRKILDLTQSGNNACAFARDTLTSLITEDTAVYQELAQEIFT